MNKSAISTYNFSNKQTALELEIIDLRKVISMKEKALNAHRLNFY